MKRFRDEAGQLTITTDELAKLTLDEANAYYTHGARYEHSGKIYVCNRSSDRGVHRGIQEKVKFTSEDGHNLFFDPDKLGTFLPDIASDGLEIVKVYDVGNSYSRTGMTFWNRAEEINGEYKNIAHIGHDRYVTFYEPLPREIKEKILEFAFSGTPINNAGKPVF